jgi:hypothetical protein
LFCVVARAVDELAAMISSESGKFSRLFLHAVAAVRS